LGGSHHVRQLLRVRFTQGGFKLALPLGKS
jgi:hypothetical protein